MGYFRRGVHTMTTTTTPTIPQFILDQWQLPTGWENHVTIQVGHERVRGVGHAIALAYRVGLGSPWMFSVSTDWIPVRCRRTATLLTQLTLDQFREALGEKMSPHNKASP